MKTQEWSGETESKDETREEAASCPFVHADTEPPTFSAISRGNLTRERHSFKMISSYFNIEGFMSLIVAKSQNTCKLVLGKKVIPVEWTGCRQSYCSETMTGASFNNRQVVLIMTSASPGCQQLWTAQPIGSSRTSSRPLSLIQSLSSHNNVTSNTPIYALPRLPYNVIVATLKIAALDWFIQQHARVTNGSRRVFGEWNNNNTTEDQKRNPVFVFVRLPIKTLKIRMTLLQYRMLHQTEK